MAKNYTWNVSIGAFSNAANWLDLSNGGTSDGTFPGSADLALASSGTITGTGTVNAFRVSGSTVFAGVFNAGTELDETGGTLGIGAAASVIANFLSVGINSGMPGSVAVTAGGTLSTQNASLGELAGSLGAVSVDGSGSSWTNTGFLNVGNMGAGSLSLSNSATLTTGRIYASATSGAGGMITVASGARLNDNAGATADGVGYIAGTSGAAIVTGAGSAWITTGRLYVGGSGAGTMTVSNGGSVSATNAGGSTGQAVYVGANSGGSGVLVVTDPGSRLSATGRIGAGVSGGAGGEIDVLNGATVATSYTPNVSYASIYSGGVQGSTGLIMVSGTGSRLDAGGGEIVVAGPSSAQTSNPLTETGTLEVLAGGTVVGGTANSAQQLGFNVGSQITGYSSIVSTGAVTIDGAGSLVSIQGRAVIGNGGSGTLILSNGGSASLGLNLGTIDSGITFGNVAGSFGGGTISSGATLSSFGNLLVGNAGTANVTVSSGGRIVSTLSAADLPVQNGINVASGGGVASLTVTGGSSGVATNGLVAIGRGGLGTLNVLSGATFTATNDFHIGYGSAERGNGTVVVSGSGTALTANALTDGADASGALIPGGGTLAATNGASVAFSGTASLAGSATLSVDSTASIEIGGSGNAAAGQIVVDAGGRLGGHGTVSGTVSAAGVVDAAGGTLTFNGPLKGTGVATIEPGAAIELTTFGNSENVTFAGGGTLRIDASAGYGADTFNGPRGNAIVEALAGGTIDFVGHTGATASISTVGGNVLTVRYGSTSFSIALAADDGALTVMTVPDGGTGALAGTNVVLACFAEGTRIRTADGERPVEALREGDLVATTGPRGERLAPIAWIGHRRIACALHPRPHEVWPVRVRAGAFGPGAPLRDLLLSPDHAVFAGGALVAVRHLVDGVAIVQEPRAQVRYFHVELPAHDIVFAEGLPCESYLDTGNRADFANGGAALTLHPALAGGTGPAAIAPLATDAATLARVRALVVGGRAVAVAAAG